jgi:hypothetical protein
MDRFCLELTHRCCSRLSISPEPDILVYGIVGNLPSSDVKCTIFRPASTGAVASRHFNIDHRQIEADILSVTS